METFTLELPSLDSGMRPHRWTRQEFEHLVEIGAIQEDDRVELIHGLIVDRPMQNPPHAHAMRRTQKALAKIIPQELELEIEKPLVLGQSNLFVPDFSFVPASELNDPNLHPSRASLVVEVADSSLLKDRREKLQAYAEADIPEYWIVNLMDQQLEVYRQPDPKNSDYRESFILRPGASVSPLATPGTTLPVKDLLPESPPRNTI